MINKRGLVRLLTCLGVLLLVVAVGSVLGQERPEDCREL